ncbi:MAG: hypothetical protein HUU57_04190 [Bdellovibrio sp.]|nr:hypothetical protein [Bdellovibrio sp.]
MKKSNKLFCVPKASKFLTFFIVMTVLAAMAATGHLLYESSGTSKFQLFKDPQGTHSVVQTSQDYQTHVKYSEVSGAEFYLVGSQKTLRYHLDADGVTGSISWSVRKGEDFSKKLWSRTESATTLNVNNNLPVIVSGLSGCCAEQTGYRLFDIESGQLLLSFNDFLMREKVVQPYVLSVPNSSLAARYIGVISQDSTRDLDFVDATVGKQAVLLIKYAADSLKQKIQLDMDVAAGFAPSILEVSLHKDPSVVDSAKIEIVDGHATLWNVDGTTAANAITGVYLKLVVDAGNGAKIVKIPVKNDQFDLTGAELPQGVVIHPIVQLRTFNAVKN